MIVNSKLIANIVLHDKTKSQYAIRKWQYELSNTVVYLPNMRKLILCAILFFVTFNVLKAQTYSMKDTARISKLLYKARDIYNAKEVGRYEEALGYVQQATVIAEAIDEREYMYTCYTSQAKIYGRLNMPVQKQKFLLKAKRLNIVYSDAKKKEIERLQQELDVQNSVINEKESQLTKLKDVNESQKIYLEKKEKELTARDTALLMQQLETDKQVAENKLLLQEKELTALQLAEKDYQSKRLLYILILAVGAALILLYLYFIKRKHHKESEVQNEIIMAEKKKSDELLLNILPYETAEELKQTGKATARLYNDVTVMFTDFKDFTKVSEKLSPTELVEELDKYFKTFDEIISKYKIEKIKTIGDAYLCVSGLPQPVEKHAYTMAAAALEIRQFIKNEKQQSEAKGKVFFDIRIGLHSGSVVAGIVGVKKFAFDIWGDTVNTAARMEQSGIEGEVNISGATYELIKDKFPCQYRGKINAKNKGEIDMYLLA